MRAATAQPTRWVPLIAVTVMTCAMCGAVRLATPWFKPEPAVPHLATVLESVPDDRLIQTMRERTAQEPDGSEQLLAALESTRLPIVYAARTLLIEKLDEWMRDESTAPAPRLLAFSERLADRVEHLPAAGQDAAAHVATRLLLLPVSFADEDSGRLVAECEWILRIQAVSKEKRQTNQATRGRSEPTPSRSARHSRDAIPIPPTNLPGGGLPIEVSRIPDMLTGADSRERSAPR